MNSKIFALGLVSLGASFAAQAQVTIDFQDVNRFALVEQGYNGGSTGASFFQPATQNNLPNYGVSFTGGIVVDGLSFEPGAEMPQWNQTITNFWYVPGPSWDLDQYINDPLVMSFTGGFSGQITLDYASREELDLFVRAYDQNHILQWTRTFGTQHDLTSLSMNIVDRVYSLQFSAPPEAELAGLISLDNIVLGAPAPVTAVPEPSTYGLIGAGALAGLGLLRRFRRKSSV